MPLAKYGVWKANPVHCVVENRDKDKTDPHLTLYFPEKGDSSDYNGQRSRRTGKSKKDIPGLSSAAINIKSGDKNESELAYWVDHNFDNHPMINRLTSLSMGFHSLKGSKPEPANLRLDYIRRNLFNVSTGRILHHDKSGPLNDIVDILEPEFQHAIDQNADVYLFGEPYTNGKGLHNVHMNQGSIQKYKQDDGVFQDGGILIHYPRSNRWIGVFIGFASQAVHTDEKTGRSISPETWNDHLATERRSSEVAKISVTIDGAAMTPSESDGPPGRRRSVILRNSTDQKMPLSSWKIQNSAGQFQALPSDAALSAMSSQAFNIPNLPLSNFGDTITLLNAQGLKVDGVRYRPQQNAIEGRSLVFAH
jgi:uncharacterized protein YukJ